MPVTGEQLLPIHTEIMRAGNAYTPVQTCHVQSLLCSITASWEHLCSLLETHLFTHHPDVHGAKSQEGHFTLPVYSFLYWTCVGLTGHYFHIYISLPYYDCILDDLKSRRLIREIKKEHLGQYMWQSHLKMLLNVFPALVLWQMHEIGGITYCKESKQQYCLQHHTDCSMSTSPNWTFSLQQSVSIASCSEYTRSRGTANRQQNILSNFLSKL